MNTESKWKQDLKSPWLYAVLGTVVIALAVNGVLIYFSMKHPHSLVARDYYAKGKAYFHERAISKHASENLVTKLMVPGELTVNSPSVIRLNTTDRQGKNLENASAKLFVYRLDDMNKDFQLDMKPAAGAFEASVSFPLPGNWDIIAQVNHAGEKADVAQRIFVRKTK